jgi:hypothetical protein
MQGLCGQRIVAGRACMKLSAAARCASTTSPPPAAAAPPAPFMEPKALRGSSSCVGRRRVTLPCRFRAAGPARRRGALRAHRVKAPLQRGALDLPKGPQSLSRAAPGQRQPRIQGQTASRRAASTAAPGGGRPAGQPTQRGAGQRARARARAARGRADAARALQPLRQARGDLRVGWRRRGGRHVMALVARLGLCGSVARDACLAWAGGGDADACSALVYSARQGGLSGRALQAHPRRVLLVERQDLLLLAPRPGRVLEVPVRPPQCSNQRCGRAKPWQWRT